MDIFTQLRDIISDKKNLLIKDIDTEKEFLPYMTQRWLSFHSIQFAQILNLSSNVLWKAFDDKQLYYKLFLGIIPKSRFKNIKYIKKEKTETKTKKFKYDEEMVVYIAERFELSRREVRQYFDCGDIDLKHLKSQLKS